VRRRPRWLAIAGGASFIFLASAIVGVTFCDRHAETLRAPVEIAQHLEDVVPQVDEIPFSPAPAELATPACEAAQVTWHAVGNWAGCRSKETDRFTVGGSEWRISWKTTGDSPRRACALGIYVYDGSGAFVTLAANRRGVVSDVFYMQTDPGQFYISVISCAADWEITVEDSCREETALHSAST